MQSLKQQHGMTAIGWLLVLLLIVVFSLGIIKLVPIYMGSFKITSALESLKKDPMAVGKQPADIKKLLLNRFDIDMLQEVTPDEITVTRGDKVYNVRVEHQFKEQMLDNLYVVLLADESVEIPIAQ